MVAFNGSLNIASTIESHAAQQIHDAQEQERQAVLASTNQQALAASNDTDDSDVSNNALGYPASKKLKIEAGGQLVPMPINQKVENFIRKLAEIAGESVRQNVSATVIGTQLI